MIKRIVCLIFIVFQTNCCFSAKISAQKKPLLSKRKTYISKARKGLVTEKYRNIFLLADEAVKRAGYMTLGMKRNLKVKINYYRVEYYHPTEHGKIILGGGIIVRISKKDHKLIPPITLTQ